MAIDRKYWDMARDEGAERLQYLGVMREAIDALKRGEVWESLQVTMCVIDADLRDRPKVTEKDAQKIRVGVLYEPNGETLEVIKRFCGKYPNYFVYHVITTGNWRSILYIKPELFEAAESPDKETREYAQEELKLDREELMQEHIVMAYVDNGDNPEFSEFGTIGVAAGQGGLIRTA